MLHCSAADGGQWSKLNDRLGPGYEVFAPNQIGCGDRPRWDGARPFTLSAEAEAVMRVLDGIDGPVHLVGHSYGGALALHVALARPQELRSLTLIEPSAFHLLRHDGPLGRLRFNEIKRIADGVGQAVLSGDLWGGMQAFVDYWNGPGDWARAPEEVRGQLSRRLNKVTLDFRALFAEETTLGAMARIGAPTLVVQGDASPAPSRQIVDMLAGRIPGAQVAIVPGAGHMSPFTHAADVNDAIAAHIETAQVLSELRVA